MVLLTPAMADVSARPARRLLVAAALAALLAAAVYVVFVHTALGQRFDNAALYGAFHQQPKTRATDQSFLHRISADSFLVVLIVIALLGILRRRPRLGIAVAASAGLAVVAADLLKYTVLTRPALVRSDVGLPGNSFPSGHTATALACALALVVVSPPRWRGVAAVVAGSYGWVVAARVQTAGWHRPSDAIGGALFAFASVGLVTAAVAAWRPVARVDGSRHVIALAVLGVIWVVSAVITAINVEHVLHFLVGHPDASSFSRSLENDAYQISVNLTVVVVVSLLFALLAMIGRDDLDSPVPG